MQTLMSALKTLMDVSRCVRTQSEVFPAPVIVDIAWLAMASDVMVSIVLLVPCWSLAHNMIVIMLIFIPFW